MNDELPTSAMMQAGALALVQCGVMSAGASAVAVADSVWRAMQEVRPAEPAQPAPAADAVPVVAMAGPGAVPHEYVTVQAPGYRPDGPENLVRQSDHLAAMEALRADLSYSQDALQRLAEEMEYRGNSVSFIYDKAEVRGQSIDEVFAALRDHGVRSDGNTHVADLVRTALEALRQEVERLKALIPPPKPAPPPPHFGMQPTAFCGGSLKADRSPRLATEDCSAADVIAWEAYSRAWPEAMAGRHLRVSGWQQPRVIEYARPQGLDWSGM